MNKYFFFLLLSLGFLSQSIAQDSGLSFELHYPIDFEKSTNQYTDVQGIFGGSLQYQLTDNNEFNYGIEYKFDLNQGRKILQYSTGETFNFLINHINFFTKLNLDEYEKFKLYIAAGFSVYNYNKSSTSSSYTGFNGNLGFTYDLIERIYFQSNFSYVKAFLKQKQTGYVDTESRQIIRLGIGFKL
jgi:hypothetical protein